MKYIILGAVIIAALFAVWNLLQKPQQNQQGYQEDFGGYGIEKPFYSKTNLT